MGKPTIHGLKKRARDRAFAGRSDAYRWLRRRHQALVKLLAEHEPGWADVAAEMDAAGVKGGQGKPLTADAVRRIWRTVCRDVEAAGSPRPRPQQQPPGWKPTAFAPVRAKMPEPGAAPVRDGPMDDVDARIEAMRREAAERSGR